VSPITTARPEHAGTHRALPPEAGWLPVFHVHATFSVFTLSRLMSSSGE
jgi:hypothetical protein